jgi:UTP:GlnB (protein PII) uridylyltransferase
MPAIESCSQRDPASEFDPLGGELECPDDEFVFAYVRSMRTTYRRIFDEDAQHEHAAIAYRRRERASHIEIWRELPNGIAVIAVIADDRPGLLSRISAAIVAHDLDVIAAQAHGRRRIDGGCEAVDFFWVRRVPDRLREASPVCPHDVAHLGETLDVLVRAEASPGDAATLAGALRLGDRSSRLWFERDPQNGATSLHVEAEDRPGLLLVVSQVLFEARVQIVSSHVTTHLRRAHDRFLVTELNGLPLDGARQLAVQTAVLAVLDCTQHMRDVSSAQLAASESRGWVAYEARAQMSPRATPTHGVGHAARRRIDGDCGFLPWTHPGDGQGG